MKITKSYLKKLIIEQLSEERSTIPDTAPRTNANRITKPDISASSSGGAGAFDIAVRGASRDEILKFIPKIEAFAVHYGNKRMVDSEKIINLINSLKDELEKTDEIPE